MQSFAGPILSHAHDCAPLLCVSHGSGIGKVGSFPCRLEPFQLAAGHDLLKFHVVVCV